MLHHGYRGSVLHDRYRLAQDQFVTGRFGQGGGAELVTLAHGLVPGGDYRASAMAFRVAATRPGAAESIPIAISEEVQPVAPFRVAGEGHDRLLALQAECGDEACSARAIDWKLPLSWGSQVALTGEALSLGVGSDWMRQPAQVVEPAVQGEGDWLVLTRVKDGGAPGMDEASYVPATVRLEYKAFKRAAGGWEARGGACVSVDISAQVRANLRAALANRYFPSTGDTRSVEKAKAQTEACAKSGGGRGPRQPGLPRHAARFRFALAPQPGDPRVYGAAAGGAAGGPCAGGGVCLQRLHGIYADAGRGCARAGVGPPLRVGRLIPGHGAAPARVGRAAYPPPCTRWNALTPASSRSSGRSRPPEAVS